MKRIILLLTFVFGLNICFAQTGKADYRFDESVYLNEGDSLTQDLFFFGR